MNLKLEIILYWILSLCTIFLVVFVAFFTDDRFLIYSTSQEIDKVVELEEDNVLFAGESLEFTLTPEYSNVESISVAVSMDEQSVFEGLGRLEQERLIHNTKIGDVLYKFDLEVCNNEDCINQPLEVNSQIDNHTFAISLSDYVFDENSKIILSFLDFDSTQESRANNYVLVDTEEDYLKTNIEYKIEGISDYDLLLKKILGLFTNTQWSFIFVLIILTTIIGATFSKITNHKYSFMMFVFLQLLLTVSVFELAGEAKVIENVTPPFENSFQKYIIYVTILLGFAYFAFSQKNDLNSKKECKFDKRISYIALLASLFLFIIVRVPFLDANYVNQYHADKYSSYLPTSQYIYEQGDPFVSISPGTNDIESEVFERDSYSGFPFYEWVFAPFWFLEDTVEQEVIVHWGLTLIGIALLILIFELVKKSVNSAAAILSVLILAVSPFFQLFTFITIMDLPAFIFFVLFVILLYNNKNDLAYVAAGSSVLLKLSFGALVIPLGTAYILYTFSKDKRLFELMKFYSLSLIQFVLFKVLITNAPSQSLLVNVVAVIVFVSFLLFPIFILKYRKELLFKIYKRLELPLWMLGILGGLLVFANDYNSLLDNFAPEPIVLLTPNLYLTIINDIVLHSSVALFITGMIGGLEAFRRRDYRLHLLALSSAVYFVVGSKVIYFHIYYKHIFVFVLIILATYLLLNLQKKSNLTVLLSLPILIMTMVSFTLKTPEYIDRNPAVNPEGAAVYINETIENNQRILRSDSLTKNLVLYSDKLEFVNLNSSSVQRQNEFKDRINEVGFSEFLLENGVTYYVNLGSSNFESFAPLLFDNYLLFNRKDVIRGSNLEVTREDTDIIKSYFELVAIEGEFYIYKVKSNEESNSNSQ